MYIDMSTLFVTLLLIKLLCNIIFITIILCKMKAIINWIKE